MGAQEKIDEAAGEQTERQMYCTHSPECHSPQGCAPLKFQSVPSDSGTCPSTQSTAAERPREMNTGALEAAKAKRFNLMFITDALVCFQTTKSSPTSRVSLQEHLY